jgi:hypothetical protein
MEEKVYYDDGTNKVTSSRFIANGTTHALNGITSVKQRVVSYEAESKRNAIIAIVIGAFIVLVALGDFYVGGILFGAAIIGLGVFLLKGLAPAYSLYHIVTASASGETEALSSRDGSVISEIENALNEAIIGRG